jgi:hypothetical protein
MPLSDSRTVRSKNAHAWLHAWTLQTVLLTLQLMHTSLVRGIRKGQSELSGALKQHRKECR